MVRLGNKNITVRVAGRVSATLVICLCLLAGCKLLIAEMCVTVSGGSGVIASTGFDSARDSCADEKIGQAVTFISKSAGYAISSCTINGTACVLDNKNLKIYSVVLAAPRNDIQITLEQRTPENGDFETCFNQFGDCLTGCSNNAENFGTCYDGCINTLITCITQ